MKYHLRIGSTKVQHTCSKPKYLKRSRSGSIPDKIEGNFDNSANFLENYEHFSESKKVGNKIQKLEGMGSDIRSFSTGTSMKFLGQKQNLNKSKLNPKIKELTPVRDLEIDDNPDAERDSKKNG